MYIQQYSPSLWDAESRVCTACVSSPATSSIDHELKFKPTLVWGSSELLLAAGQRCDTGCWVSRYIACVPNSGILCAMQLEVKEYDKHKRFLLVAMTSVLLQHHNVKISICIQPV